MDAGITGPLIGPAFLMGHLAKKDLKKPSLDRGITGPRVESLTVYASFRAYPIPENGHFGMHFALILG